MEPEFLAPEQDLAYIRNVAGASRLDLELIQRDVRHLRTQINRRNDFLSNTLAAAISGRERMEQAQRRLQESVRNSIDTVISVSCAIFSCFLRNMIFGHRRQSVQGLQGA